MTTEQPVLDLLAAGDTRAAAEKAIEELGPTMAGYLRSVLRNDADAADAFATFCERLWRGIGAFRGEASLRTWAFKIAWHVAQSVRDEPWRRLGRPFATGEASKLAEDLWTRTADRVERQRDQLSVLRESLSPEEQTLLTLRIDQGLAWDEIVVVLAAGESPADAATLRKRFERLKDRLARLAREQGLIE